VFRSIAVIVAAIQISQPKAEDEPARVMAQALQQQAQVHDFDPLTGVSIIFFESNFQPKVISPSGEDYGLAQIRARYIGACKQSKDPVKNPTRKCRAVKQMLLDPAENIRVMAELITQNRRFCKKKVGSAKFHRWLASYQGRNYPKRKRWCQAGKGTWKVIRYREHLLRELRKQKLL